jgi:cobaltochelatase CobT
VRWFKDWDERVTNNQLFSRFDQASGHLTQNADGDALMYAYASLLQRKEHRKMLVVLSDGSPCGRDWAGNGREYLKDVVRTIIAHKQVDLYGIGILDDNVSHYYPKHSVLKSLDSLAPAVLSVLDI